MKRWLVGLALIALMVVPAHANEWTVLSTTTAECTVTTTEAGILITPNIWEQFLRDHGEFLKSTTRRIGNRGDVVSIESTTNTVASFTSNLELCKFLLNDMIKAGVVKVR